MLRISKLALGIHPQAFVDRTRLLGVRIRMLRISKHPLGDLEKPISRSELLEKHRTPVSILAVGSVEGSSPSSTTAGDLVPDRPEQLILEIGSKSEGLDVRSGLGHRRRIDRIDVLQGADQVRRGSILASAMRWTARGRPWPGRPEFGFRRNGRHAHARCFGFRRSRSGITARNRDGRPEGGCPHRSSGRFGSDFRRTPPSLGSNFEGRRRSCPVPGRSQAFRRTGRWTSASTEVNMETA